jgi:hypothetical protein
MRYLGYALGACIAMCTAQPAARWTLPNFAQRLEVDVSNPSSAPVSALAIIPVAEAARRALQFPGTLAIAVMPGAIMTILPSQADDLDGDGVPDEFVFPVQLAAGETRPVHIYYSTTLHDSIPWPKRVHASHAFGYNRATVALESERIGYRTYGGFFLDIQARTQGKPGLYNSLVGYFGSGNPVQIGEDVIHLGDTLGLGGLFLRAGEDVYRPPLNMPDYAHKPSPAEAPEYRVIADGPVRAVVEARMERWSIGDDAVLVRALYSMGSGAGHVECRYRIVPLRLSRAYEVGAGIRHLPNMKMDRASGRLALFGTQTPKVGPLGLALYFDPDAADVRDALATKDDRNECIVFRQRLEPGRAAEGRYWLAGAWSGSGIHDLLRYLGGLDAEARASVSVGNYRFARTPDPQRVEGEAN